MNSGAIKNKPYPIEVTLIDTNGNFVLGQNITYEIRKSSDDSLFDSGNLIEENNVYRKFITFINTGYYNIKYYTPISYENGSETIYVFDNDIDLQLNKIDLILGLVQHNFRVTDQIYDSNHQLLSATINIYSNASDATNQINPIATYKMTAIYNSEGELIDYKVVEN